MFPNTKHKITQNTTFFIDNNNMDSIRLMHQNIAGFLCKNELLEITLENMSENNKIPDIICLSETFVQKNNETNIHLKGYTLGASFCRSKQKRGGVCILHLTILLQLKKYHY